MFMSALTEFRWRLSRPFSEFGAQGTTTTSCACSDGPHDQRPEQISSELRRPEPVNSAPGMPSYGWQLNDSRVAAVLTYIRNSWGNAASAVSPDNVARQRAGLAKRS